MCFLCPTAGGSLTSQPEQTCPLLMPWSSVRWNWILLAPNALSAEEEPSVLREALFSCYFTWSFRPGGIPTPTSREALLSSLCKHNFSNAVSGVGSLLELVEVQPEEAVHQKFTPVSLQWAKVVNEINLSAWVLQGGQNFRPIYF